jgi:hypothetical protein
MGNSEDIALYQLTQHVCRICFGRILSRVGAEGAPGKRIFRCADCGAEKDGHHASVVCVCGVKLNARNAAIRCVPNEHRRPEFPFEICARQA